MHSGYWNSSYAVDGRQMRNDEDQNDKTMRTCMATKQYHTRTMLTWMLNLNTEYYVQGVNFFGRYNYLCKLHGYLNVNIKLMKVLNWFIDRLLF